MKLSEALGVLGLQPEATWDDIKTSYRTQLRKNHPDLTSEPNASATTARLVEAFGVVRDATDRGVTPLASAVAADAPDESSTLVAMHPIVVHTGIGDVYERLCAALESVGEISYLGRHDRLVQVAIERAGFAPSHLTAEVVEQENQTCILFTLDPLTNGLPPRIEDVVAELEDWL